MKTLRILLLIVGVGLITAGGMIDYGPDLSGIPGVSWLWSSAGKIDRVVVVYESKNQPPEELGVLLGNTARSLRKVDKWRQYDKDKLPEGWKTQLELMIAKSGVPCIGVIKGTKITAVSKMPKTDEALAAYVKKNGGT
jgi:hypothetical protein